VKSVHLLLVFLLAATALVAQDHSTSTMPANTVLVGADGSFEAPPDTVQLQLNVSEQETTSQSAYEHASKDVEQARQVLRANGLDPKQATVGFFSVQPVYEYKPKQHVTAYRVTTSVTLKLKDFSKIGPITQQLADANIGESQSLNYILQNMDEAKNHAVEDAYRRARNSAEVLARASGRTLGDLSSASVDTFESPRPVMHAMARAMTANAPAPMEDFTPQNVTVTAHVNALFNLK
jgi:uncharacterized protein